LTTGTGPVGIGLVILLTIVLAGCWPSASAVAAAQPPARDPDIVRVSQDQMHQLDIAPVKPHTFRVYKVAVGQIAFNEVMNSIHGLPVAAAKAAFVGCVGVFACLSG
jgi:hypothetical protein